MANVHDKSRFNSILFKTLKKKTKMLKSEINVERACRSCLEETTNVFKISDFVEIDTTYKSSFTIAEILMECTAIKIMPDDELIMPQSICSNCTVKVQEAFSYKKMCEESDEKLRAYLRTRMECESQLFDQIDEQSNSPEIEKIHINDLFSHDDLLDENNIDTHDFDDFGSDTQNFDGGGDDDDDDSDYEPESDENETKKTQTVEHSDGNQSPVSKSQYKMGEDFQVLNKAKQVNGRYQCEMCEKTLADRRTFLLHTRLHLGKNLKHCDICGKGFAKKNHLDRHQKVHTRKSSKGTKRKRTIESDCDESSEPKNPKRTDAKRASTKSTSLEKKRKEESTKSTNSVTDASTAIENTNIKREKPANDSTSNNPSANTRFVPGGDEDELSLVNSAEMLHGGRLQCPICPRTLSHRKILRLHIRSHLGKNLSHCKICNRGFAKGSNLNRHMLLHCRIDSTEESRILQSATQENGCYSCPYCAKTLIDRQTFRLHIRLHISKTLIRCEICNRGFDDDNELEKHMTCHGNEFPCNNCDQLFNTFGERKEHIRTAHIDQFEESGRTERVNRRSSGKIKNANDTDAEDDEDKHIVEKSQCVDGRYECVFCKKTLANRTTLKYHIRLHLGKHLLKCDICSQGFSKKSHLKRHIATHGKKKPCRFCDEVFETFDERRTHTVAAHKDATLSQTNKTIIPMWTQANGTKFRSCIICNATFDRIYELKSHLDWHVNNPKTFDAFDFSVNEEMCDKFGIKNGDHQNFSTILYNKIQESPGNLSNLYSITNESGWELSISDSETENEDFCDENDQKYCCGKCERHFDRLHKLMCHMKVDHNAHTQEFHEFKCTYCMQCFPNQNVLAKHLRQQCENKSKTAVCLLCNNRFTWKTNLEKHVAIYHEADSKYMANTQNQVVRPFKCEQCIKSFYRPEQLEAHKSTHLPRPKRFTCDICKKRFSRTDNLKSHMRVHIPVEEREVVNKHLCSYCGRSFSNSSNLTVHIRRHTGERPFSCEFCDARFPRSSDLQCHRRTHTGEKTCVCTVCGKGFTRSNKLVRHMRIHTGERPYKCPHCDRAFTQSNDLTLHVRRHTGDKPFGCICGERFITNSLLQMHRRTTGHIDDAVNYLSMLPTNSVNNPHRKWKETDGKRTGITATLSSLQQQHADQDGQIGKLETIPTQSQ